MAAPAIAAEALKHFFAAVNRNDMQAIVRDFDPQIVRVEPEGTCRSVSVRQRFPPKPAMAVACCIHDAA